MKNKHMPSAVLFDFDNTLVDTNEILLHAINEVFEHFNYPLYSMEEVKRYIHRSAKEYFKDKFGDRAEKAAEIYYQGYIKHQERRKIFDGAKNFVEYLYNNGIYIAIVSNKRGDILRKEVVQDFGMQEKFFSSIVGAGDALEDKPSKLPGLMALEKFSGIINEKVWFLGDTITDYLCAKNLGVYSVIIGDADLEENIPDLRVRNYNELFEILRR